MFIVLNSFHEIEPPFSVLLNIVPADVTSNWLLNPASKLSFVLRSGYEFSQNFFFGFNSGSLASLNNSNLPATFTLSPTFEPIFIVNKE